MAREGHGTPFSWAAGPAMQEASAMAESWTLMGSRWPLISYDGGILIWPGSGGPGKASGLPISLIWVTLLGIPL